MNSTDTLMEDTFTNLVAMQQASCQRFAERPLFGTKRDHEHHWMTYTAFAEQVDACRAGLSELGVGPGDAVAIISNNRVEWAITAYATFGLEGIFIPMYLEQHADDWAFIINDCRAKVLITSKPQCWEKIREIQDQIPHVEHSISLDQEEPNTITFHQLCKAGKDLVCKFHFKLVIVQGVFHDFFGGVAECF